MPKIYRECVQCQHDYYISEKDQVFFEGRELELPKRCWSCRKKNRVESQQKVQQDNWDNRPNNQRRRSRAPQSPQQFDADGGLVEFFTSTEPEQSDSEDWTDQYRPDQRKREN